VYEFAWTLEGSRGNGRHFKKAPNFSATANLDLIMVSGVYITLAM